MSPEGPFVGRETSDSPAEPAAERVHPHGHVTWAAVYPNGRRHAVKTIHPDHGMRVTGGTNADARMNVGRVGHGGNRKCAAQKHACKQTSRISHSEAS
jgi:hypothetical protein